jgi:hypothetical protein
VKTALQKSLQKYPEATKKCFELLERNKLENSHLLCCIRSGSDATGVFDINHNNDQLTDFIGVYAAPLENVFSPFINQSKAIITEKNGIQILQNAPSIDLRGIVLYEVGVFLNLLVSGNHRAVESLFFSVSSRFDENIDFASSEWMELVAFRNNLIFRSSFEHCRGLAESVRKKTTNWSEGKEQYLFLKFTRYAEEMINSEGKQINIQPPSSSTLELSRNLLKMDSDLFLKTIQPEKKLKDLADLIKTSKMNKKNDPSIIHDWFLMIRKK